MNTQPVRPGEALDILTGGSAPRALPARPELAPDAEPDAEPEPAPGTALVMATPTALTPGTPDQEWISRETSIRMLEAEAQSAAARWVDATLDFADTLREHKLQCRDQGERPAALWESVGLTQTTAYRLIGVSELVRQYPALRGMAAKAYTRASALIEGASPELIQRIAEDQEPTLPRDDLDCMSVREIKRRLKALSADVDKEVKRQTKVLTKERDALAADNQALRSLVDPTWEGLSAALKRLRAAQGALIDEARAVLLTLANIEGDDVGVRNELELAISGGARLFEDLWQRYQERASQDWPSGDDD